MLAAALLAAMLLTLQTYRVHQEGWEWRLWPSETPPKVSYQGRDYDRGGVQKIPDQMYVVDTTPGGGEIYSDTQFTPTLIWLKGDDTTYAYGLMGGP